MENVQHKLGLKRAGRKWYRRLWKLFSAAKDRAKPLSDQVSLTDQSCAQQTVFSGVAPASAVRLVGRECTGFTSGQKPLCDWGNQQLIVTHKKVC